MKDKKNKYKKKDTEKRRKEWDKTRREVNNKKWRCCGYDHVARKTPKSSPAMVIRNTFSFFYFTFFF